MEAHQFAVCLLGLIAPTTASSSLSDSTLSLSDSTLSDVENDVFDLRECLLCWLVTIGLTLLQPLLLCMPRPRRSPSQRRQPHTPTRQCHRLQSPQLALPHHPPCAQSPSLHNLQSVLPGSGADLWIQIVRANSLPTWESWLDFSPRTIHTCARCGSPCTPKATCPCCPSIIDPHCAAAVQTLASWACLPKTLSFETVCATIWEKPLATNSSASSTISTRT